jgi:hypothetical protein
LLLQMRLASLRGQWRRLRQLHWLAGVLGWI